MDTHAYQNTGHPAVLMIGVQPGQVRPTMWLTLNGTNITLASFHGEEQAGAAVEFLDAHTDDIQKVIDFHNANAERKNGSPDQPV